MNCAPSKDSACPFTQSDQSLCCLPGAVALLDACGSGMLGGLPRNSVARLTDRARNDLKCVEGP